MRQYLELMRRIREQGADKDDRTGVGTQSVFGAQLRFDLAAGFPAVTTKFLRIDAVIHELLWFLRGETNIRSLNERGVGIWNAWADESGELGPIYGSQWRRWPTADAGHIDQIEQVIESIERDPDSRRHIVSAWNPGEIERMALPPCHLLFQFYVSQGRLSCQLYQRSADIFLGTPFNIASYSLLTMMVAQVTGYQPGEFIHVFGDVHLYRNHREQADKQLAREPHPRPRMKINPDVKSIFDFRREDFELEDYRHHPPIRAPIAV